MPCIFLQTLVLLKSYKPSLVSYVLHMKRQIRNGFSPFRKHLKESIQKFFHSVYLLCWVYDSEYYVYFFLMSTLILLILNLFCFVNYRVHYRVVYKNCHRPRHIYSYLRTTIYRFHNITTQNPFYTFTGRNPNIIADHFDCFIFLNYF